MATTTFVDNTTVIFASWLNDVDALVYGNAVASIDMGAFVLLSDVISESTSAAGVTIDSVLLKDGGIVLTDGAAIDADIINEATSATGVTADGVLMKDGGVVLADGAAIDADIINEATAATGVTIDGFLIKDGALTGHVIGVDIQAFDADTAKLDTDQAWTGSQAATFVALSDAATVLVDFNTEQNMYVTITASRTIGAPSNQTIGQSGFLIVEQDGTGGWTPSFHADWDFGTDGAPSVDTTAAKKALFSYIVDWDTVVMTRFIGDF